MTLSRVPTDYYEGDWNSTGIPVAGPVLLWDSVDYIIMHYRGALKNLVPRDVAASLRRSHLEYLQREPEGYSLGYNWGVVSQEEHLLDGTSWTIRGEKIRNAANAPRALNMRSVSILVMQVDNHPTTSAAKAEISRIVKCIDRLTRRPAQIIGHGQAPGVTSGTPCPGEGVLDDIKNNVYRQPPQPPKGPTKMQRFVRLIGDDISLLWQDGRTVTWVRNTEDIKNLQPMSSNDPGTAVRIPVTYARSLMFLSPLPYETGRSLRAADPTNWAAVL